MDPELFKKLTAWGIAVVAALVLALAGAWGYSSYRQHSLRQAVAPQERAADQRLREALAAPLEPAASGAGEAAAGLEAAAQDIETRLEALNKLDAGPDPVRVAMVRDELENAAGIVRKEAAAVRSGIAFEAARAALIEHMRRAGSRTGAWVSEAIARKKALDKAYFNYKFALDGFAARLGDVPDQQLAGQVRARVDTALEHAKTELARASSH